MVITRQSQTAAQHKYIMEQTTIKGEILFALKITEDDYEALNGYLGRLREETTRRFGPHPFNLPAIQQFYRDTKNTGFMVKTVDNTIIAYAIIREGYVEGDYLRYQRYGITISAGKDCTLAPSVADEWQGSGVGSFLYNYVLETIKKSNCERIILWGGVQATNERAVNFYRKHGFTWVAEFEYNGPNYDMVCTV